MIIKRQLALGAWAYSVDNDMDCNWKTILSTVERLSAQTGIPLVKKYVDILFSLGTISEFKDEDVRSIQSFLGEELKMSMLGGWCLGMFDEHTMATMEDRYVGASKITDKFDLSIMNELYPEARIALGTKLPPNWHLSPTLQDGDSTVIHTYVVPVEASASPETMKLMPRMNDRGLMVSTIRGSSEEMMIQLTYSKGAPERVDIHPGRDWFTENFHIFDRTAMAALSKTT